MIKIFLFLIFVFCLNINCFIVKDEFLSCKITKKLISCNELDCKNINISVLKDFEDKFHILNRINKTVVYSLNRQLYLCDCMIVKEIVVPEEIEINNKCIKDIYVQFNNQSGFLNFNGVIRERTTFISCSSQVYYYYSLSKNTLFEKCQNKISFSQTETLKYEVEPYSKDFKLVEFITKTALNIFESQGIISETNEEYLIISFAIMFIISIVIIILKFCGFNPIMFFSNKNETFLSNQLDDLNNIKLTIDEISGKIENNNSTINEVKQKFQLIENLDQSSLLNQISTAINDLKTSNGLYDYDQIFSSLHQLKSLDIESFSQIKTCLDEFKAKLNSNSTSDYISNELDNFKRYINERLEKGDSKLFEIKDECFKLNNQISDFKLEDKINSFQNELVNKINNLFLDIKKDEINKLKEIIEEKEAIIEELSNKRTTRSTKQK